MELGNWLLWTGKRWKEDNAEQIIELGESTANSIFEEAEATGRDDRRRELEAWAAKSCNRQGISNMLKMAQPKLALHQSQLDQDPWLLNCENGTLDLRTGELRDHRREDWITKLVPVSYDPEAKCDLFRSFLDQVMGGDQRLQAYVQRALGYSLTGDTREQCWFVAHGSGANGKSTLLNLFRRLLGDYARNASIQAFTQKKYDGGPREDLVRLRGARFVTSTEAEENQKLAASLIKQVTGGDTVTARNLYQGSIEYIPEMKPWLATNHVPALDGADEANWRRVKLIPFKVVIPEGERDPDLPAKLWKEAPGILAWAVWGALDWQTNAKGLEVPEAVVRATNAYRYQMDDVCRFNDQCLKLDPDSRVTKGDMYDAYLQWARDCEGEPLSKPRLTKRLKALGLVDFKSNDKWLWRGVSLIPDQCQSTSN
jgi:putative DNA primase/helicase